MFESSGSTFRSHFGAIFRAATLVPEHAGVKREKFHCTDEWAYTSVRCSDGGRAMRQTIATTSISVSMPS
jgi:hypothetical protein